MFELTKLVRAELDSAFAPRNKLISIPVVSTVANALGSVASNIGNAIIAHDTNSKNAQLQRETNAQNYKMFKEQQAFNVDMWNKQNEYNLPANQVQRLLAAGINPSAVFGNGATTPAGEVQSVNPPTAVSPHMNPWQMDLRVGDAVNAFQQSELNNALKKKYNAEAAHTETLNTLDMRSMESKLRSLESMSRRDDALGEIARSELRFLQDSYWHRMRAQQLDVTLKEDEHSLTRERIYNQRLQNGLAEVQLAYAPRLNQAQLQQYYATVNQIKAQIGLINANKTLTEEQRLHEIEKKTGTIIDNGLKGFDFNLKNQVKKYIVMDYANSASLTAKENADYNFTWWNRTIQGYIPFASGSATQGTKKILGL